MVVGADLEVGDASGLVCWVRERSRFEFGKDLSWLTSRLGKASWLASTVLRWTEVRLPSASVSGRVATVLTWLSLACCEGVTPELGLRATITFRKPLCSLVLREIHGGVGSSTVEDSGVVVHYVPVEAWRRS